MKTCNIALLGCGTVGTGLVQLVTRNRSRIRDRAGVDLAVTRILVRDLAKPRPGVDRALLTDAPEEVIANGADVVVEVLGGLEPARTFVTRAIAAGKHVVTANKALLAAHGVEILRAAATRDVRIGFEASVCAGIPIVRALSSGLAGERIRTLAGILNGTCNYILTRMSEDELSAAEALREAQARGFAEADPALDIDGHDAAQKLAILAELAFGVQVVPQAIATAGIRAIDAEDIRAAKQLGYVIKHVALASDRGSTLELRVGPALLPRGHVLAGIRDENNAVSIQGDAVGEIVFHGKGAGGAPTASAVLSDIVELARGARPPVHVARASAKRVLAPAGGEHYLRFPIHDRPGAIGRITTALGDHGVSIAHAAATLVPEARGRGNVKVSTHRCETGALRRAVDAIAGLPFLTGAPVVMPILAEQAGG